MKILIVTSSGGHLMMTYHLKKWWEKHERVWVTKKDQVSTSLLKGEDVISGFFPENRNLLNLIKNLCLSFFVIKKKNPDLVFSMGAAVAVPFFVMARLFRIKTVYVETYIFSSKPSLTGKIIYNLNLATYFMVQNKKMIQNFPKAKYWGSIIDV